MAKATVAIVFLSLKMYELHRSYGNILDIILFLISFVSQHNAVFREQVFSHNKNKNDRPGLRSNSLIFHKALSPLFIIIWVAEK